nr:verprolin-like [Camelus dromedarius]
MGGGAAGVVAPGRRLHACAVCLPRVRSVPPRGACAVCLPRVRSVPPARCASVPPAPPIPTHTTRPRPRQSEAAGEPTVGRACSLGGGRGAAVPVPEPRAPPACPAGRRSLRAAAAPPGARAMAAMMRRSELRTTVAGAGAARGVPDAPNTPPRGASARRAREPGAARVPPSLSNGEVAPGLPAPRRIRWWTRGVQQQSDVSLQTSQRVRGDPQRQVPANREVSGRDT